MYLMHNKSYLWLWYCFSNKVLYFSYFGIFVVEIEVLFLSRWHTYKSPTCFSQSMQSLKNFLNDIQTFMWSNKLKLNPDQTELILKG